MRGKGWQGGRSQGVLGFDVERSSALWPALQGKERAREAGEQQADRKPLHNHAAISPRHTVYL